MASLGSPGEDRERARVRAVFREQGTPERRISETPRDLRGAQEAGNVEDGREIGEKRPSGMLFGSGG
jgi:hypothetical protein